MLRGLVDEVVRRRLWPIPLVAILIAVAAPLLFMKSAGDTPANLAPPPVAQEGNLSPVARDLLSADDKTSASGRKVSSKAQDPFAPPASAAKPKPQDAAAVTPPPPAAAASSSNPIPVVIQNSDGSTSTMSVPSNTKKASAPKSTSTRKSTTKRKKKATVPKTTAPVVPTTTYVDARFGARQGGYLRFRVPHLQAFRAGGRVAAMFLHYSAKRHVAVFAVAPSTQVKGDVGCREVKGVCRYVDIPAGSYARLVLRDLKGRLISRRLDVVRVRRISGTSDPAPRENPLDTATCLLKGLLKLAPSVPSIASDACA